MKTITSFIALFFAATLGLAAQEPMASDLEATDSEPDYEVGHTPAADGTKYTVEVRDFTHLRVYNNLNVNYVCSSDSTGFAVFEGPADVASAIIFTNNGKGRLTVERSADALGREDMPAITVYSSFLTKVENNSDSLVRVVSVAPCPKFESKVVGNGRIVVRDIQATDFSATIMTGHGQIVAYGKCVNASFHTTGTGSIQADGLCAENVDCRCLGTGSIGCWATKKLVVKGAMKGNVYYKGSPSTIKNYGVGTKLISLDD